jgi:creatinine amidohydrolase
VLSPSPKWRRYEELRPDELAACLANVPVAFWPLGLLEHHGWQLPVGFDGLKADALCRRIAGNTGGVILPTMWWGGGGGHGDFLWTHCQSIEAAESILVRTIGQLITFGFRVIVLLAGHYPWKRMILDHHLPELQKEHPNVLLLWGTEIDIADPVRLPGDHASREETSYGLALFPRLVDMQALRPGRGASAWPGGSAPVSAREVVASGKVRASFADPGDPLFAQAGVDAREASAEHGEEGITRLVARLTEVINGFLAGMEAD